MFRQRERQGRRSQTVMPPPPTYRTKGPEGRVWWRKVAEAARGFRNQIPVGMKAPSPPTSHVPSHLVPQMFGNICLNHSVTLFITCPSVTDRFLHVDGSYLLLTGFGGFLCDQHESRVLNE